MPAPGVFFALAATGIERFYFVVKTVGDSELHIGVRNPSAKVAIGYAALMPAAGGSLYDTRLVRLTVDATGPHNHLLSDRAASIAVGDLGLATTQFQSGLEALYTYLETLL